MTLRAEGRLVLRNALSFGSFLSAPFVVVLLSRALGPSGYGRWWWTFGILETAAVLGMFGTDLYVRRELPRRPAERRAETSHWLGAVAAIPLSFGALFAGLQCALAASVASAQGDAALLPFLYVLACQPLLWNVMTFFSSALQAIDVMGTTAVLRGVFAPAALIAALWLAWHQGVSTTVTLSLVVLANVVGCLAMGALYGRHFSLWNTCRGLLAPRAGRGAWTFGAGLFLPLVLWCAGTRLEFYVLGRHLEPAALGVFGACLQIASTLVNLRAIFDPVAQAQIAQLPPQTHGDALTAALRRLSRVLTLVAAPAFVVIVSIGEPVARLLLNRPTLDVELVLVILCAGQMLSVVALGSWLAPMAAPGRLVSAVAGTTLVVKLVLLVLLVPRLGLVGAAIGSSVGAIVALHGQAFVGARVFKLRSPSLGLAPLFLVMAVAASAGRWLWVALGPVAGPLGAVAIAATGSLVLLGAGVVLVVERAELVALKQLVFPQAD